MSKRKKKRSETGREGPEESMVRAIEQTRAELEAAEEPMPEPLPEPDSAWAVFEQPEPYSAGGELEAGDAAAVEELLLDGEAESGGTVFMSEPEVMEIIAESAAEADWTLGPAAEDVPDPAENAPPEEEAVPEAAFIPEAQKPEPEPVPELPLEPEAQALFEPVKEPEKFELSIPDFKGRSFLTLLDYTPEEIGALLDCAAQFKRLKKAKVPHRLHEGKNIALIFEKTSTRTRCAFEVAGADLGMHPVYLDPGGSQLGKKESIADTARVLGRMFDGIEYRGYGQERVEALAKYAGVPVWNGLTNEYHPTQILADLLTMREIFGALRGLKLVYFGDARYNMGNSLMIGCAKMGVDFVACAPAKYFPSISLVQKCRGLAAQSGSTVRFITNQAEAVRDANVLYTDVWVSMGEPEEVWAERINDLAPYRVTRELMDMAAGNCVFMHCLPAFHDLETGVGRQIYESFGISCMEVTDEVFNGERSVVFDEAENRMHTIKAVMAATL